MQTVDDKGKRMDAIIRPFVVDNISKKQGIELCQVGKFLSLFDSPASILERRESPDFLISIGGEVIGLEHESILDENVASDYRSIAALFNDAAKVFSVKHPDIKILADIHLCDDGLVFGKHERARIIDIIVDYFSKFVSGYSVKKPDFIDRIIVTKHSRVRFSYNPGGFYVETLNEKRLISAIEKKEKKIADYIQKSNVQKQWLLLTTGTYEPDSFEFGDAPIKVNVETFFDRIYLLEDFNYKCWRIK